MLKLNIKSISIRSLDLYSDYLKKIGLKNVITIKQINIPKNKKRFTLLKSPHVNKKAQENFQFVVHQRSFYIKTSLSAVKNLLINKPKHLKITMRRII